MPAPEYFQECACVMDCHDCSQSGEWHVHAGDECVMHPEAVVS